MSKVTVHIDGHGTIKVRRPKRYTNRTYADGIAKAVAETMQLVTTRPAQSHPAIGWQEPNP